MSRSKTKSESKIIHESRNEKKKERKKRKYLAVKVTLNLATWRSNYKGIYVHNNIKHGSIAKGLNNKIHSISREKNGKTVKKERKQNIAVKVSLNKEMMNVHNNSMAVLPKAINQIHFISEKTKPERRGKL